MRIILLVIVFLIVQKLEGQSNIPLIENQSFRSSSCYRSYLSENPKWYTTYLEPFILELHPAQFDTILIDFTLEDVNMYQVSDTNFMLPTYDSFSLFKWKGPDISMLNSSTSLQIPMQFCYIKIPESSKSFARSDFIDGILYIQYTRTTRDAYISYTPTNNKPTVLNENQYFFKAGEYSSIVDHAGHGIESSSRFWKQIQGKLIDEGYKLNPYKQDANLSTCLKDYLIKNGRNPNLLDIETCTWMGLKKPHEE